MPLIRFRSHRATVAPGPAADLSPAIQRGRRNGASRIPAFLVQHWAIAAQTLRPHRQFLMDLAQCQFHATLLPAGGLIPPVAAAGLFLSRSRRPVFVQVAAPGRILIPIVMAGIALSLMVVLLPPTPNVTVCSGVVADDEGLMN